MGDFFIPRVKLNKAMILIQFCVNSSIFPLNNQFFAKIKVSENPFMCVAAKWLKKTNKSDITVPCQYILLFLPDLLGKHSWGATSGGQTGSSCDCPLTNRAGGVTVKPGSVSASSINNNHTNAFRGKSPLIVVKLCMLNLANLLFCCP